MSNDLSTIPSLKGENPLLTKSLSSSTKIQSSSDLYSLSLAPISSDRLLRETNELINHLEKAEKNVEELHSEIPKDLLQILDSLEKSSKTIKSNSNITQSNESEFSNFDSYLSEQLETLETELKNDIQTKFSDYNLLFKKKFKDISIKIQKANVKQEIQSFDHTQNIDDLLINIAMKEQGKIYDLEEKLNKLKKYSQPIEDIMSYSGPINLNTLQIKELQKKLSLISNSIDISNKNDDVNIFITSNAFINLKSTTNSTSNHKDDNTNFNSKNSLDNILDEIDQFKNSFNCALLSSYNKVKECEIKMMEIEQISNDLQNSINILDDKLAIEETLIHDILEKVENLKQKTKDKSEHISLQVISEQIKSTSNNMHSLLSSIKKKVLKCEMSVPLLSTD